MIKEKVAFEGRIISVQPRIRLIRSFDERSHNYLGYALHLDGVVGGIEREFSIGIGKGTQAKHEFSVGDKISGECLPVPAQHLEPVEFYKVTKLKKIENNSKEPADGPPWQSIPPLLEQYRQRGHRRLSAQTYNTKCMTCIWGCQMPVELIIDHWNPTNRRYRFETFCYGPKSCRFYKAGPIRKVPGRKGMVWEEPDWVDEQETEHRGLDD